MNIVFKIIRESLKIAVQEIWSNKLRSFLSLTGITIGIFCIIAVLSAVDSLKNYIQSSFEVFGNDVLYVQKMPWPQGQDYPWWKYMQRPEVGEEDRDIIEENSVLSKNTAISAFGEQGLVTYGRRRLENVYIVGASDQYDQLRDLDFAEGRFFTDIELYIGKPVCILGGAVSDALFPGFNEILGREIEVRGMDYTVIGVLKPEGDFLFNFSLDDNVLVPWVNYKNKLSGGLAQPVVMAKTVDNVDPWEHIQEIRGIMRQHRKIKPREDDNFAINRISIFIDQISQLFGFINIAGLIIGGFSILVGGFGIANIMFVSVKERTSIIGIKKALGAKRIFILLEFLIESAFLCLIGGIIGLLFVFLALEAIEMASTDITFDFYVSTFNLILGLSISVFVGLIFGFIPAYRASRMKPVDAIRSK